MTQIHLQFELTPGAVPQTAAADLQKRLQSLPQVTNATAEPLPGARFGLADAVTILVGVITVAKHGKEAVTHVRSLVREIKLLVKDSKSLANCFLELGPKRVSAEEVDKMSDAEIEENL